MSEKRRSRFWYYFWQFLYLIPIAIMVHHCKSLLLNNVNFHYDEQTNLEVIEVTERQCKQLFYELLLLRKEINDIREELGEVQAWRSDLSQNFEAKLSAALDIFYSDQIGMFDYAAEYAGGSIISTPDTVSYSSKYSLRFFGTIDWILPSQPNLILQTTQNPGKCYGFYGNKGRIRVRLGRPIWISHVSLEHARIGDGVKSAPKDFEILGPADENLGRFTYDLDDKVIQTFRVAPKNQTFEWVELRVLSNHGIMELRSRSRSKTPYQTEEFIEAESFEGNNHVTVTRSSRRTTRTTIGGTASEQYNATTTKPSVKTKSTKSTRNVALKTSDYSSEEGEIESTHISQNEKNQIIEDAKRAANGNTEISALSLYRKAGRYWDKYPKTDYTYSPHSRDRVELAPGVVQMPNMSRRTIHSYDSSTNTDSYFDRFTSGSQYVKQRLFSSRNNNMDETDESYKIIRASSLHKRTVRTIITSVFTSIYTAIFWCFYTVYDSSNSSMIWLAKHLHHFASRLMLLDTWLLRKSTGGKRTRAVIALCLLPLLFFAGLHVLLASGVSLAPFCHPHCGRYVATYYNSFINAASNVFN